MDEQQQPIPGEVGPNLIFLKILCVITFIGSGYLFLVFGVIGFMYEYIIENFSSLLALVPTEVDRELIKVLFSAGRLFFILNAILYATSISGALLLWRMKKIGFHLYTVSQILILIISLYLLKGLPNQMLSIFMTILFIWGYSGFLKFMK